LSVIELRKITKSYDEAGQARVILDETSASFQHGEYAAILGRSGSGKSTLLNVISGIDQLDSGSVHIDGIDVSQLSDRERTLHRREHIGFVFQFFNLISTLTVWENVILPGEIQGNGKGYIERARSLLEAVGLEDRGESFPDQLSGGEQQRVAIARALVHDPALVLADEPTGNLDADTGNQVLELLDRLTRQAGKNMIMVTHSREAAGFADRVLRLQQGRFVDG
jgi:putative ABC transport system ATP-binding protein